MHRPLYKPKAVLRLPRKIGEGIVYARKAIKAMKGNPTFTSMNAQTTQVETDTNSLSDTESAVRTHPPTTTTLARDTVWATVYTGLGILRNLVQNLADLQAPAKAGAIILAAGMEVKKRSVPQKRKDSVSNGKALGSAKLTAEGSGYHQWQRSPDGGTSVMEMDPTTRGEVTVTDLTPGNREWFRTRLLTRNNQLGEWTEWMMVVLRQV